MVKRVAATILWFLAVWGVGGVIVVYADVPRAVMLAPAIAAAAMVWVKLGPAATINAPTRAPSATRLAPHEGSARAY